MAQGVAMPGTSASPCSGQGAAGSTVCHSCVDRLLEGMLRRDGDCGLRGGPACSTLLAETSGLWARCVPLNLP